MNSNNDHHNFLQKYCNYKKWNWIHLERIKYNMKYVFTVNNKYFIILVVNKLKRLNLKLKKTMVFNQIISSLYIY